MEEKVEALVFKIFWFRLQEQSYVSLTPCCRFQMQPKELCSWARSVAGRVILNACQSTWSKHTAILSHNISPQWQTAPQPFVIITEPFQLKDKSCGLASACYLELGMGQPHTYGRPLGGQGRAPSPLPQVSLEVILLSSFQGAKARRKIPPQTRWQFLPAASFCIVHRRCFGFALQIPYSEID